MSEGSQYHLGFINEESSAFLFVGKRIPSVRIRTKTRSDHLGHLIAFQKVL
jgi:hypothetical protein